MDIKTYCIFWSQDSIYKKQYLKSVDFWKSQNLKKYSISEYKNNSQLYYETHHIIPRWYYRNNKLELDNTSENKIIVPYKVHVELHILLKKHFQYIHDNINYASATEALKLFLKSNHISRRNAELNDEIINELLKNKIDAIVIEDKLKKQRLKEKKLNLKSKYTKIYTDYKNNSFDYVLKKYNLDINENKLRNIFKYIGFKLTTFITDKTKNKYYSDEEIIRLNKLFREYGYTYIKNNYTKVPTKRSIIRMFKKLNLPIYNKLDFAHKHKYSYEEIKILYDFYIKNNFNELQKKFNYQSKEISLFCIFKSYGFVDKNISFKQFLISVGKYVKKQNSLKNKKCINKNGINKYVENDEIQLYLNSGWKIGSVPFTNEHKINIKNHTTD